MDFGNWFHRKCLHRRCRHIVDRMSKFQCVPVLNHITPKSLVLESALEEGNRLHFYCENSAGEHHLTVRLFWSAR